MIIDCISDLHGQLPELEGGDLLIIAGDFTSRDTEEEHVRFCSWLSLQDHYRKKIIIAGNHDNMWFKIKAQKGLDPINPNYEWFEYLCDSGTEFEGLKIWGSPWTTKFKGMNPHCMAFTVDTDEELAEKWALIPDDVDILITHCPPYGILDKVHRKGKHVKTLNNLNDEDLHCGSRSLRAYTLSGNKFKNKKLHIFGHIHEGGGKVIDMISCKFINASHVNERYKPVNKPIRVIL
jgi:predicted phosphodiesterase